MHALLEPWQHGFMQRAVLELVVLGAVGAVLGTWVIAYELSFSAESLAHALFPGLVVAALLGFPLVAGGAVGVLVAAAAVAVVGRTPAIGRDSAVAVVITTLFGLGVVLALAPASPPGLESLLFGDLLGVSNGDLALAAGLAAVTLLALAALHRALVAVGFDRGAGGSLGVRPLLVDLALLGLIAVAIVIGVQALGNLLVLAVVIAPAATARLLGRRFRSIMAIGALLAALEAAAGLYLSYYADVAAGASVAGVMVAAYLAARAANLMGAAVSRTIA
jgi:ABC-type Mn2+/Zn2+ transport system permease subunit